MNIKKRLKLKIAYPAKRIRDKAEIIQDAINRGKITLKRGNEILYEGVLKLDRVFIKIYKIKIPKLKGRK